MSSNAAFAKFNDWPMSWFSQHKRAAVLLIAFVCFGTGVLVWKNTAGVSGEIFIVSEHGKAMVVPGASIRLLKLSEHQAHIVTSDFGKKLEAYTSEVDEHMSELRSNPDEVTSAHAKFANNLSAMKYCLQIQSLPSGISGNYIQGNAGRDGRFSISVAPGIYLLQVDGQAGETYAEWFQIVRLNWREEFRLVQPTCSYSQQN